VQSREVDGLGLILKNIGDMKPYGIQPYTAGGGGGGRWGKWEGGGRVLCLTFRCCVRPGIKSISDQVYLGGGGWVVRLTWISASRRGIFPGISDAALRAINEARFQKCWGGETWGSFIGNVFGKAGNISLKVSYL